MSHTPGPWEVDCGFVGPTDGDNLVERIHGSDDDLALIAAAPELLAMLERLQFAYFDTECFCPICHGQNEHYIECDLATLLKKVRGGT